MEGMRQRRQEGDGLGGCWVWALCRGQPGPSVPCLVVQPLERGERDAHRQRHAMGRATQLAAAGSRMVSACGVDARPSLGACSERVGVVATSGSRVPAVLEGQDGRGNQPALQEDDGRHLRRHRPVVRRHRRSRRHEHADARPVAEQAQASLPPSPSASPSPSSSPSPSPAPFTTPSLIPEPTVEEVIAAADDKTALAMLGTLAVKGRAPRTGYDRNLFGQAWADTDRNGCDTRFSA